MANNLNKSKSEAYAFDFVLVKCQTVHKRSYNTAITVQESSVAVLSRDP